MGTADFSDNAIRQAKANTECRSQPEKIIMKYNESHPQDTLPLITPHSLRHMFCTRLVLSGMNLKAIQYIMGHKKMEMTLELYSHMNEKNAIKAFRHYMTSDTNFDTNSHKNM